jgi:hypothetical protein
MRFHSRHHMAPTVLFSALSIAGTADVLRDHVTGDRARPHEIVVTAGEFYYEAPDTIPAGFTKIRFVNEGTEFHLGQLVQLLDGHTAQELKAQMATHQPPPAWARFVGGPNTPMPNGEVESTLELAPGDYAFVCPVSSPSDHAPHAAKGMVRALTVVPSKDLGRAPRADARIVLDDYDFVVAPAIRAGRRTIRVENVSTQPHEVGVLRLERGKTVDDVMAWLRQRDGAPPAEVVGGSSALSRGVVTYIHADFTSGDYVLVCFVPDRKDGKSHYEHGMVRKFRVD